VKYHFSGKLLFIQSLLQLNYNYSQFFSYDTEALNKHLLQTDPDEKLFVNTFTDTDHKKITLGVQQLYIIGNISNFYFIFQ
jgi:hypothetical protein